MDHEDLDIVLNRAGHCLLVSISGELDIAGVPKFEAEVATAMAAEPGEHVVVECSGLSFVDSAGLAAWVRLSQGLDGNLALAAAPDRVTKLLELTGLQDSIPTYPDVDAAVASFH